MCLIVDTPKTQLNRNRRSRSDRPGGLGVGGALGRGRRGALGGGRMEPTGVRDGGMDPGATVPATEHQRGLRENKLFMVEKKATKKMWLEEIFEEHLSSAGELKYIADPTNGVLTTCGDSANLRVF